MFFYGQLKNTCIFSLVSQIMFIFEHIMINSAMAKEIFHPNRIRVVLAEKQITNRWLAEQLGVTDMTVSRWSTNKVQPSVSQLVEIAKLLEVDIKNLIEADM